MVWNSIETCDMSCSSSFPFKPAHTAEYINSSCYIKHMELISHQISNFELTENFKNLIHRYYTCFRPSLLYNHGSLGYSSNKNTACIPFVPFTVFSYYLIHNTLLVTIRACRTPIIF